jgi:translocator protein
MDLFSTIALAGFIGACFVAALIGSLFRPGDWYEGLDKPAWRPPNKVFAPVWTVLYLMIAASGWLVWRSAGFGLPLAVYFVQLALNAVWSYLFFGRRRPDLGFYDILALWIAIAATIALFAGISGWATALLVPYFAWVSFAAALNFSVWRRNPRKPAARA